MNKKGFTLIELLVVIAIIGLLSAIVLNSLNAARGLGRDAKRVSELKSLANALELYKLQNGSYPSTVGLCGSSWCSGCYAPTGLSAGLSSLVSGGFISSLPSDPLADTSGGGSCFNYEYISQPGVNVGWNCGGIDAGNYGYAIRFETERTQFKLPAFQWNRSPNGGGEYCILPPT